MCTVPTPRTQIARDATNALADGELALAAVSS
jgi:hypothetical protein